VGLSKLKDFENGSTYVYWITVASCAFGCLGLLAGIFRWVRKRRHRSRDMAAAEAV
jgi:hypothetical protein